MEFFASYPTTSKFTGEMWKSFGSAFTSCPSRFPHGSASGYTPHPPPPPRKTGEDFPTLALLAPLGRQPRCDHGLRPSAAPWVTGVEGTCSSSIQLPGGQLPSSQKLSPLGLIGMPAGSLGRERKRKQPDTLRLPTKLRGAAGFPPRWENKCLLK